MGRAIEVDKRHATLENKVNEILLILDELSQVGTKQEHIELHEKEEKETNSKSDGVRDKQSDNRNAKKSTRNSKNSKSSKWVYRI